MEHTKNFLWIAAFTVVTIAFALFRALGMITALGSLILLCFGGIKVGLLLLALAIGLFLMSSVCNDIMEYLEKKRKGGRHEAL